MSRYITDAFKYAIGKSHLSYEKFAERVGLNSKQNLSYWLNHKEDDTWAYEDIKNFCKALGINHTLFLQDVDRKRGNNR